MKPLILSILIFLFVGFTNTAFAQDSQPPSFPNNGLSLHVGTSPGHSLVSVNMEHYKHSMNGKHHWGIGYGFSAGGGYMGFGGGAHIMGNYWSGRGKNHFEARLGVAPTYFTGGENESATLFPVPIILVGYRRQAPGSGNFFFFNVGSVGIGIGFGKALGKR